jgi:hypothetical protein
MYLFKLVIVVAEYGDVSHRRVGHLDVLTTRSHTFFVAQRFSGVISCSIATFGCSGLGGCSGHETVHANVVTFTCHVHGKLVQTVRLVPEASVKVIFVNPEQS